MPNIDETNSERLSTRLPKSLIDDMQQAADDAGMSRSAFARKIIEDAISGRVNDVLDGKSNGSALDAALTELVNAQARHMEAQCAIVQAEARRVSAESELTLARARRENAETDKLEREAYIIEAASMRERMLAECAAPKVLCANPVERDEVIARFASTGTQPESTVVDADIEVIDDNGTVPAKTENIQVEPVSPSLSDMSDEALVAELCARFGLKPGYSLAMSDTAAIVRNQDGIVTGEGVMFADAAGNDEPSAVEHDDTTSGEGGAASEPPDETPNPPAPDKQDEYDAILNEIDDVLDDDTLMSDNDNAMYDNMLSAPNWYNIDQKNKLSDIMSANEPIKEAPKGAQEETLEGSPDGLELDIERFNGDTDVDPSNAQKLMSGMHVKNSVTV